MPKLSIAVIFMILLISQGNCRPDKPTDRDVNYPDDTPQEYDDDDTDVDNESSRPVSSGPPEILSKPMVVEVRPGANVELPCRLNNADEYAFDWKKDGSQLYFGGVLMDEKLEKKISRTPDNSLIIYNVTKSDTSDNYTCSILIDEGSIEIVHRVHVVNKVKEPKDDNHKIRVIPGKRVEVNEGESVSFGCETKHPSQAQIKWSHKGERLHNGEIVGDNGNYITIRRATRHHFGRYQCLAEDESDKPAHDAIEIIVKYTPVIEVEHKVVHTGIGQTSQLICKVFAYPHAKVTWMKDEKPITNRKDKRIINEEKTLRTLTIEHTTEHDLGSYVCVASNSMGRASADILVSGTPAKPKFIGGKIADDETTMVLKWHVESFSPILEYKLEYRQKDNPEWKLVMPNVENGNGNQFVVEHALKDLHPGTSYEARLAAKNEFGWSPHSASHKFDKEYVADEPQNVKGNEKSTSDSSVNQELTVLITTLLVFSSYLSTCV